MQPRRILVGLALGGLLLAAGPALAHWCSNIWSGATRLVVKPETSTVTISGSTPVQLKVYLQNNLPWKLISAKMRGSATGYLISVSPASQHVQPGQQVLFTFTITRTTGAGGTVQVSSLNLQVQPTTRISYKGASDPMVNQSPSQSYLVSAAGYGSTNGDQSPSLHLATLADKYGSATLGSSAPFFGRTGLQQLIHWFGYRFCYSSGGSWRCQTQNCPSPCAEGTAWTATDNFPQNCMRAGADLAVRKAKLGSELTNARNAAANAITKGGSNEHKCLAAVVGGHLWKGASSTATFESALNSASATCKAAGLRALGKGTSSACTSGQYYEQAACAAAEGLAGNDTPVKSVLLPNAGDGDSSGDYDSLYYGYMLYIVSHDRIAQGKWPSFYPQVGPGPEGGAAGDLGPVADSGPKPDGYTPSTDGQPATDGPATQGDGGGDGEDEGCACSLARAPAPGSAPVLLLALAALLGRGRRRRTR